MQPLQNVNLRDVICFLVVVPIRPTEDAENSLYIEYIYSVVLGVLENTRGYLCFIETQMYGFAEVLHNPAACI